MAAGRTRNSKFPDAEYFNHQCIQYMQKEREIRQFPPAADYNVNDDDDVLKFKFLNTNCQTIFSRFPTVLVTETDLGFFCLSELEK